MAADSIITSIISGLLGGVIITLLNYFLNKRKTDAEIAKLKAETKKLNIENQSLSNRIDENLKSNFSRVFYDKINPDHFDFLPKNGFLTKEGKIFGDKAGGEFHIIDNILNINRIDNNGKFELRLNKYLKEGLEYLKKDSTRNKNRNLHFSYETKITGEGSHDVEIVIKDNNTGEHIVNDRIRVDHQEWKKKNHYLRIPNTKDFYLRMDNKEVKSYPSSIQFKNLKLVEM